MRGATETMTDHRRAALRWIDRRQVFFRAGQELDRWKSTNPGPNDPVTALLELAHDKALERFLDDDDAMRERLSELCEPIPVFGGELRLGADGEVYHRRFRWDG
jgi:hypothetical protein